MLPASSFGRGGRAPRGARALRSRALRDGALVLALTCVPAATPLLAQSAAPDSARRASPALVSGSDAALAGALFLGAAAVAPLDRRIARWSQQPSLQSSAPMRGVARTFNTLGGAGLVVVPVLAWGAGRIAHEPRIAATGVRVGEAVVLGSAMTFVVKGLVGRARPYVVHDSAPGDMRFGRGFGNERYSSFPSGHATAAWAAAGMLDSQLRMYWPRAERVMGPVAYAGALLVSMSRIYADKHWASDVIAGAGMGSLGARIVARYHRTHRHNIVDHVLLSGGMAPERTAHGGTLVPVALVTVRW